MATTEAELQNSVWELYIITVIEHMLDLATSGPSYVWPFVLVT